MNPPEEAAAASAAESTDAPIGWYGKLPAVGDFVSRRLPDGFVQAWDRWLQEGIARSRERHGERWQDLYLTFPVWRFVMPPGAVDASPWCGTLLPSVDRVGRCFPLTIARALPAWPAQAPGLASLEQELARFEKAGLLAIEGASIEAFEEALGTIALAEPDAAAGGPVLALEAFADPEGTGRWPLPAPLERTLARAAERLLLERLDRRSLWWLAANDACAGTMRLVRPPLAAELVSLLIADD